MTITYNGTTAGSTSQNPPSVLAEVIGGQFGNSPGLTGGKLWLYNSTNVIVDLTAPAAITDGSALGMKTGDPVIVVQSSAGSSAPIVALGVVGLVTASSGASLSSNVVTSTAQ